MLLTLLCTDQILFQIVRQLPLSPVYAVPRHALRKNTQSANMGSNIASTQAHVSQSMNHVTVQRQNAKLSQT